MTTEKVLIAVGIGVAVVLAGRYFLRSKADEEKHGGVEPENATFSQGCGCGG